MSDATPSITPDDDGALARRIAARRSTPASAAQPATHDVDAPATKEMTASIVPLPASIQEGLKDRIADRRSKPAGDGGNGEAGGDGEGGSIGKHIAREPLFVGLGFPAKHGGAMDPNAPRLQKGPMDRAPRESLGEADPQPERARKFKP